MIRHEPASKWIVVHGNGQPTILAFIEDGLLVSEGDDVFFLYINSTHEPIMLSAENFSDTEEGVRERLITLLQNEMSEANKFLAERSAVLANLQQSPLMGEPGVTPIRHRPN